MKLSTRVGDMRGIRGYMQEPRRGKFREEVM